jgi:hypothetical protein
MNETTSASALLRRCYGVVTHVPACRYFQGHLQNKAACSDIEISVYCDVVVFAWLLQYAQYPAGPNCPVLSNANVMAVLISSSFLQMDSLVAHCVSYVAVNFHDLVQLGADVGSLAEPLLQAIAKVHDHMCSCCMRGVGATVSSSMKCCMRQVEDFFCVVAYCARKRHSTNESARNCSRLFRRRITSMEFNTKPTS